MSSVTSEASNLQYNWEQEKCQFITCYYIVIKLYRFGRLDRFCLFTYKNTFWTLEWILGVSNTKKTTLKQDHVAKRYQKSCPVFAIFQNHNPFQSLSSLATLSSLRFLFFFLLLCYKKKGKQLFLGFPNFRYSYELFEHGCHSSAEYYRLFADVKKSRPWEESLLVLNFNIKRPKGKRDKCLDIQHGVSSNSCFFVAIPPNEGLAGIIMFGSNCWLV